MDSWSHHSLHYCVSYLKEASLRKFKIGDWIVVKDFKDWYDVVQAHHLKAEDVNSFNATDYEQYYKEEFPQNVSKVQSLNNDTEWIEINHPQYDHHQYRNDSYLAECFRLATEDEIRLAEILYE